MTAVGARPLAITDNMNFGNPEKPGDHGPVRRRDPRHGGGLRGARLPGRVRQCQPLQRDRGHARILPTPAIGGLGVLEDAAQAVGLALRPWLDLVLIGATQGLARPVALAAGDRRPRGRRAAAGRPRRRARGNGDFVRAQILAGTVRACHDVSDGGLLVAVAEMAMAGRHRRPAVDRRRDDIPGHAFWFGEDQARYVLAVRGRAPRCCRRREAAGIPAHAHRRTPAGRI